MRRRILIIMLAILMVGAISVASRIAREASAEGQEAALGVSLVTYSNDATGSKFAILAVTNQDSVSLEVTELGRVEVRNTKLPQKVWSSVAATNLPPGCECTVTVELPMPNDGWRTFWWVTRQTLKQRLTWKLKADRDFRIGTTGNQRFWYGWLDNYYGESHWSSWMQ
jgi:hypothetical protein